MADYGKLLSRIWSDPQFTALDPHAQQLYCLLISYSTRNYAGVLPLTLKRWAKSSAGATVESVTAALQRLGDRLFVVIDWDTEEVLVRTYVRNDEVYRQPNVMQSARKSALQTESPTLRRALSEEFRRLPPHKEDEKTDAVANALAETPAEPFAEPFTEPFAEPFAEPPGVGVSVSGVRVHQHLHPSPSPTPGTEPFAEPPARGRAATRGADLVREIVPRGHPDATLTALRLQASELLNNDTDPDVVRAALRLWCEKPAVGIGRTIVASLVSEVIKSRNAPSPPNGKPHKMRALVELAQETAAQEARNRKELPA